MTPCGSHPKRLRRTNWLGEEWGPSQSRDSRHCDESRTQAHKRDGVRLAAFRCGLRYFLIQIEPSLKYLDGVNDLAAGYLAVLKVNFLRLLRCTRNSSTATADTQGSQFAKSEYLGHRTFIYLRRFNLRYVFVLVLAVALSFIQSITARAEVPIDSMSPAQISTELAAIKTAKSIVNQGNGSLQMAGAVLSTQSIARGNVLTIIDHPEPAQMTPGMILLLAKRNCAPDENCLVARRVIGHDSTGGLQTERYGTAEEFLLESIQATLLGRVVYAVDLETGYIRDMRPGRKHEFLTLEQAIAEEKLRFRQLGS
jgi:hypothetical protein